MCRTAKLTPEERREHLNAYKRRYWKENPEKVKKWRDDAIIRKAERLKAEQDQNEGVHKTRVDVREERRMLNMVMEKVPKKPINGPRKFPKTNMVEVSIRKSDKTREGKQTWAGTISFYTGEEKKIVGSGQLMTFRIDEASKKIVFEASNDSKKGYKITAKGTTGKRITTVLTDREEATEMEQIAFFRRYAGLYKLEYDESEKRYFITIKDGDVVDDMPKKKRGRPRKAIDISKAV